MSEAQILANRANAQRSTGPVTARGKAVVAQNASRHGLLAREPVLAGEDVGAFEGLRARVREELQPRDGIEAALVDRVVSLLWRLQRLGIIEAGILTCFTAEVIVTKAEAALRPRKGQDPAIARLLPADGTENRPTKPGLTFSSVDPGEREDAARQLAIARAEQRRPEVAVATGFMRAVGEKDYLGLLSRYETTLSRDLDRTLSRLAQLQAARRAGEAPPVAPMQAQDRTDDDGEPIG